MKAPSTRLAGALCLLALAALGYPVATARAQSSAITYQGQLQANGSPANGSYPDFRNWERF